MIRVLLAEDQAMVRGALAALLGLEDDIEVLAAVADGETAWRELQRLQPDVLVTDIEMPGLSGLELAQRIQRHEPADQGGDRDHLRPRRFPAPRAGCRRLGLPAQGRAGRGSRRGAAARCIAAVARSMHAARARSLVGTRSAQRPRAPGAAPGRRGPVRRRDRRRSCSLSQGTVRNYLSEAIGKLGVGNRIEAYRLARQKGWL